MSVNDNLSNGLSRFAERPRFDDSVSQLIRSAEKFMSLRKYAFAEDQLNLAKTLEPNNAYIWAIQERLRAIKVQQPSTLLGTSITGTPSEENSERYLSVTVGSEFQTGFKDKESDAAPNPKELQKNIRQLTNVAQNFLEKGLHDKAFDSLMKAYLLDPVSPYVMSCEKIVLPAWEAIHNRQGNMDGKFSAYTEDSEGGIAMNQIQEKALSAEEQKRMDTLKLQKEFERKEREREMWRQASSPPKMTDREQTKQLNSPQVPEPPKVSGGLFSKLKLGKFLG